MEDTYILGMNVGLRGLSTHDAAACLLHNGKIVAMAEEERFIRLKKASNMFPTNAVNYCLKSAQVDLENVKLAVSMKPILHLDRMKYEFPYIPKYPHTIKDLARVVSRSMFNYIFGQFNSANAVKNRFRKDYKSFVEPELHFYRHHLCHAASASYCSPFNNANVLTVDGMGETDTTVLWTFEGNKLTQYKRAHFPNSLGDMYAYMTEYLGFRPNSDEGQVMGLAPWGKENKEIQDKFNQLCKFKNFYWHDTNNLTSVAVYSDTRKFLINHFGRELKPPGIAPSDIHKDIAFVLQDYLEKAMMGLVEELYEHHPVTKWCLAGGSALNCASNGNLITKNEHVKDLFVTPAATDDGTAIGAAILLYKELGYEPAKEWFSPYLGPEYTDMEIRNILDERKLKYEYHADITGYAAEQMDKQKILGWFQGRMEVGPRALGNRSIIADPRTEEMSKRVNLVKNRLWWRPLAPSILYEANEEYFEHAYESPYMLMKFIVKAEKRREIPAVVHIDRSARPQTVRKEQNPLYYELIKKWEEISGVPVIMNTSFNRGGKPIVCSPQDAIEDFYNTSLDELILGHYVVRK